MLKGQTEEKREKSLKTFNTLSKHEKEKVLFPWQRVLWCEAIYQRKRTFPVRNSGKVKDNYIDPFSQLGAFANIPLDVCKCSDVTQPPEMGVS